MAINAQFLSDVKTVLRISSTAFDTEITQLIEDSQEDLRIAGVLDSKITAFELTPNNDKLLRRAIITYCKAEFGWDNPDRLDFRDAYQMQKLRMTLVDNYIRE